MGSQVMRFYFERTLLTSDFPRQPVGGGGGGAQHWEKWRESFWLVPGGGSVYGALQLVGG